jgi:nicotinate-nucleotide--dimethylbenzimidazole phosphoribosyltransferase
MGPGTKNFTREPAMTRDRAIDAIEVGIGIARDLARDGFDAIGIGDMGIGNTTASSALCSVLLGKPVERCTGRGTGVDDAGYGRKIDCIRRGIAQLAPDADDPPDVLAKLGGFEIAGLCGVVLGACAERAVVVVDGFISSVAALLATRLSPAASGYLIASHRSTEAGHQLVLEALDQRALLDLGLRLGEGTGAALALGLVDASLKILGEMATFESAAVSDSGA